MSGGADETGQSARPVLNGEEPHPRRVSHLGGCLFFNRHSHNLSFNSRHFSHYKLYGLILFFVVSLNYDVFTHNKSQILFSTRLFIGISFILN